MSSSDLSELNTDVTWSLILWDYLITLDDEVRLIVSSHVGMSTDPLEDHAVLGMFYPTYALRTVCVHFTVDSTLSNIIQSTSQPVGNKQSDCWDATPICTPAKHQ